MDKSGRSRLYQELRSHTVNIGAMQEFADVDGTQVERYFAMSGFILAIAGSWYVVTAGHWLEHICRAEAEGVRFTRWHLDDGGAPGKAFKMPLPFDFAGADSACLHHEDGYDYLVVHVRDLYVRNLVANGKRPLDEQYWALPEPADDDEYYVVGTPAETTEAVQPAHADGNYMINKSVALMQVRLTSDYPASMERPFPRFIGKIPDDLLDDDTNTVVKSIEGMSGAPLFACRADGAGGRYWLIGVQSSWVPKHRLITACPTSILVDWLRRWRAGDA